MSKDNGDFQRRLMATFKVEAEEHLQTISGQLVELETSQTEEARDSSLEIIFREAHSLKGAARAVNLPDVEMICQSMETVFAAMKRKQLDASVDVCDTLHAAVDALSSLLTPNEDPTRSSRKNLSAVLQRLELLESQPAREAQKNPTSIPAVAPAAPIQFGIEGNSTRKTDPAPVATMIEREEPQANQPAPVKPLKPFRTEPASGKDTATGSGTIRIETSKLDSLFLQAEEMVSVKLTMRQCATDLEQIMSMFEVWKKQWAKIHPESSSLRRSLERSTEANGAGPQTGRWMLLLDFLQWNDTQIKSIVSAAARVSGKVDHERRALGGMVDSLLEDMKKVLMMPFSSLLGAFPKLVRDLSHDLGKKVELVMEGVEIEIDRRILEQLKDPLIHLVRNSLDHGIETADNRLRAGKPTQATLKIVISQADSNKVEVCISDDGSGIDVKKVREAAIRNGFLSHDESARMDTPEALSLIFQSEVSTSAIISDLSGRGLGLAIVREKVEKLGGFVTVETIEGRGTTFRLLLPVTLATFRGILVRAANRLFVVPTSSVERAIRLKVADISSIENRETVLLSGRAVSLVRLADLLALPQPSEPIEEPAFIQALIIGTGDRRVALGLDEVLNEQEILVKGLGSHLKRVPNIAGATVLGSGQLAPILNVPDLLKSAARIGAQRRVIAPASKERKKKSILIAEDSITSRMLLKNILETAGYDVTTAMDGIEAFSALASESFDLLVSDIEMPRMNGLDLTSKVRGDKKLSGLPVVLVTSLGSREDRERGIDVGANAYIIKSNFDQSNLLEVVRRLV